MTQFDDERPHLLPFAVFSEQPEKQLPIPDPAFHDKARLREQVAIAENPFLAPERIKKSVREVVLQNASLNIKRVHLIRLADRINEAISTVSACSNGCSHCCHMVTFIYEHEAEVMARASGKEMRRIKFRTRKKVWDESARYVGRPCPFLALGSCSIYASRPLICRLHHSLNEDPSECEKLTRPGARQGVYMYDPDYVEVPYHGLNDRYRPKEPWGAIQDFFPDQ